ncbi:hypothetical protein E6W39_28185 [Kitasatospora acidiphila]|uniref:Uncharacterized protein n=1 Tax=Kitasatospora acidiphila TaxID=2567942 RepID=A0A540WAJ0_9ACTN|nr:hypothetical protein [Kitasatospora acidiphila]TQF05404.1 hypothetical protein E6W39_28185 [Kitasatospora acidiphila]
MSDALGEVCDFFHSLDEAERITLLGELGVGGAAMRRSVEVVKTPLPAPRQADGIVSEIEWV